MYSIENLFHRFKAAFLIRRSPSLRELVAGPTVEITGIHVDLTKKQLDGTYDIYERIRHIERLIASETVEIGVIFDSKGSITAVRRGTTSTVVFSDEEELLATDHIVTHNHPNGGCLSDIDLSFAFRVNLIELRAVAGKKVHRILKPVKGWPQLHTLTERWDSEQRKVRHKRKLKQISGDQAVKEWLELGILVTKKLSLFTEPETL